MGSNVMQRYVYISSCVVKIISLPVQALPYLNYFVLMFGSQTSTSLQQRQNVRNRSCLYVFTSFCAYIAPSSNQFQTLLPRTIIFEDLVNTYSKIFFFHNLTLLFCAWFFPKVFLFHTRYIKTSTFVSLKFPLSLL